MVMAVLGGFLVLFCTAQLFNPYLRQVEDKAYLDQLAAARKGEPGEGIRAANLNGGNSRRQPVGSGRGKEEAVR